MLELNDKLILTKYLKEIAVKMQIYTFAAWLRDQERIYERSGAASASAIWLSSDIDKQVVDSHEKLSFIFELLDNFHFDTTTNEDKLYIKRHLEEKFIHLIRDKKLDDLLS